MESPGLCTKAQMVVYLFNLFTVGNSAEKDPGVVVNFEPLLSSETNDRVECVTLLPRPFSEL